MKGPITRKNETSLLSYKCRSPEMARLASAYTIPMYRLAHLTDSHALISVCKYISNQNKGGPIKNTLLTKIIKIFKISNIGSALKFKV